MLNQQQSLRCVESHPPRITRLVSKPIPAIQKQKRKKRRYGESKATPLGTRATPVASLEIVREVEAERRVGRLDDDTALALATMGPRHATADMRTRPVVVVDAHDALGAAPGGSSAACQRTCGLKMSVDDASNVPWYVRSRLTWAGALDVRASTSKEESTGASRKVM